MTGSEGVVVEILNALPAGSNLVSTTVVKIVEKQELRRLVHLQTSIHPLQKPCHESTRSQPPHQLPRYLEEVWEDFRVVHDLSEHEEVVVVCPKVVHHVVEDQRRHTRCIGGHDPCLSDVRLLLYGLVTQHLQLLLNVDHLVSGHVFLDDYLGTVGEEQYLCEVLGVLQEPRTRRRVRGRVAKQAYGCKDLVPRLNPYHAHEFFGSSGYLAEEFFDHDGAGGTVAMHEETEYFGSQETDGVVPVIWHLGEFAVVSTLDE